MNASQEEDGGMDDSVTIKIERERAHPKEVEILSGSAIWDGTSGFPLLLKQVWSEVSMISTLNVNKVGLVSTRNIQLREGFSNLNRKTFEPLYI